MTGIYSIDIVNARFIKPLDKELIKDYIKKNKNVLTIEDGTCINGLGTAIKELIVDEKLENINLKCISYPDLFIKHGKVDELETIYGLDKKSIIDNIKDLTGGRENG